MERWAAMAADMHAAGATPDAIAVALTAAGAPPIPAIKALRTIGVSLPDAKTVVDAALPPHVREANERLRELALEVLQSTDDESFTAPNDVPDGGSAP